MRMDRWNGWIRAGRFAHPAQGKGSGGGSGSFSSGDGPREHGGDDGDGGGEPDARSAPAVELDASIQTGESIALRFESELAALSTSVVRALRDDFGPQLTTLRSLAASLEARQSERDPSSSLTVALLVRQTDALIESLRELLVKVQPDALSAGGLPEGLRALAADWRLRRPDARIELLLDPSDDLEFGLSKLACESAALQAATVVFARAFDEARAASVVMDASHDGETLTLQLVHDGAGPGAPTRSGGVPHWLSAIAQRVTELGGELRVQPGEAGGTALLVRLPWDV